MPQRTWYRRVGSWLRGFLPASLGVSGAERLRGCCGALAGLLVTGLLCNRVLGPEAASPILIAPMGASAVLLFAVPASPLAQPWSIMGGNVVSALIGVTCAQWISDPLLAAPLAAALAIGAMYRLRCLHPPSGAVALTAVIGGPAVTAAGYGFVLAPVALNSLVLTLVAVVFNNATRRAYPHPQQPAPTVLHGTTDPMPTARLGVSASDVDAVLSQYDQVLDISRDDLQELLRQAEMRAYRRRLGEITCADIMSRDVVAVQFGTPLRDARSLLRRHGIHALPVLDLDQRVIGMVSDGDFMSSPGLDVHDSFWARFRYILRRSGSLYADRANVVGRIMSAEPQTMAEDMHIVELVPLMADAGLRHVAVVDARRRLSGIISQADLIATLYRRGLIDRDSQQED